MHLPGAHFISRAVARFTEIMSLYGYSLRRTVARSFVIYVSCLDAHLQDLPGRDGTSSRIFVLIDRPHHVH